MDSAEKYRDQFISEAQEFKTCLRNSLNNWNSFVADSAEWDNLYRAAHSIKSGAAFLNLGPLEERAHLLEESLLRGAGQQKDQVQLIQKIQKLLIMMERKDLGGERIPDSSQDDSFREMNLEDFRSKKSDASQSSSGDIDDFEKFLLTEAKERGENLYRIECLIDKEEPMKRARAYLVLNNLELHSTVLRTEPSMEDEGAHFNPFVLHITSKSEPDELRRVIQVDRIENIDIRKISLENLDQLNLEGDSIVGALLEKEKRKLTIGKEDLEDLHSLWQELTYTLRGTKWEASKAKKLKDILSEGRRKVEEISRFSIKEVYPELRDRLGNYGKRLNRSVELRLKGQDILMPREWLPPLLKVFQQLMRNSLVHGIEAEDERRMAGKNIQGQISLELSRQKNSIRLTYRDDGRGIDENLIRTKASDMVQESQDEGNELLQLIKIKGLSSSKEADTHSGRGVGMALVGQIMDSELQGTLLLENNPGKGLAFHLDLPGGTDQEMLQFRYRGKTYLIEKRYIRETGHLHADHIWKNRKGQFHLKERSFLPLYTPEGKLQDSKGIQHCSFWIKIRYMGKTGCIVTEELMQEKQVQPLWREKINDLTSTQGNRFFIDLEDDLRLLLPNLIE